MQLLDLVVVALSIPRWVPGKEPLQSQGPLQLKGTDPHPHRASRPGI